MKPRIEFFLSVIPLKNGIHASNLVKRPNAARGTGLSRSPSKTRDGQTAAQRATPLLSGRKLFLFRTKKTKLFVPPRTPLAAFGRLYRHISSIVMLNLFQHPGSKNKKATRWFGRLISRGMRLLFPWPVIEENTSDIKNVGTGLRYKT